MAQTKLQRLQIRLGAAATGKDALLTELLEGAEQGIKNTIHRSTLPPEADTTIVKVAVIDFNRIGTEGQQSQSFSGVSDSWIDGYPADIRAEIMGLRRARFV
jgi:hypothetical protein